jgi:hypothetical protein
MYIDTYPTQVTYTGTWTAESHPVRYPETARFGPLVGGARMADSHSVLQGEASAGVELMAETGNPVTLRDEINANQAYLTATVSKDISATAQAKLTLKADDMHSLVDFASMIAPSPDWFVAAVGVELCDHATGKWKNDFVVDMEAMDAGTDKGKKFKSKDKANKQAKDIKKFKCAKQWKAICVKSAGKFPEPMANLRFVIQ